MGKLRGWLACGWSNDGRAWDVGDGSTGSTLDGILESARSAVAAMLARFESTDAGASRKPTRVVPLRYAAPRRHTVEGGMRMGAGEQACFHAETRLLFYGQLADKPHAAGWQGGA